MTPKRLFVGLLVIPVAASGCTGRGEGANDEFAWTTSVDSTGDTVQVRITGEVSASQVRSLVTELEVGAEDGSVEETFGDVAMVLGAPDDGLVVLDLGVPAVRVFDKAGAYVRTVGGKGSGPGEYQHVNGIVRLPDDRLALWDANGMRINRYATDGKFETSWRVSFSRTFGTGLLWSDATGDLYAYAILERNQEDQTRNKLGLVRMDSSGAVIDSIAYLRWRENPSRPWRSRRMAGSG